MPYAVQHIAATSHAAMTNSTLADLMNLQRGESCQAVGNTVRNFTEHKHKHRLIRGEDMPACPAFQYSPSSQDSKIPSFERWNIRILGGNLEPDAFATAQRFGRVGFEVAPLPGSATAPQERYALPSENQAPRGTLILPPLAAEQASLELVGPMVSSISAQSKVLGFDAGKSGIKRDKGVVRGQADAWPQGNSGSLPELNEINSLHAEAPKARIQAVQGVSA